MGDPEGLQRVDEDFLEESGLPGVLKYTGKIKRCWEKCSRHRPEHGYRLGCENVRKTPKESLATLVKKTYICSCSPCPGWPIPHWDLWSRISPLSSLLWVALESSKVSSAAENGRKQLLKTLCGNKVDRLRLGKAGHPKWSRQGAERFEFCISQLLLRNETSQIVAT